MSAAAQVAFWGCAVLLAHAYVGYPLWVWALARWRAQPVRKHDHTPPVTVVMAVHNNADALSAKLDNLLALDYPAAQLRIVVACDGCSDDSAERVRTRGDARVQLLEFGERRGKTACLNDAVASVAGGILLMTDVRQRVQTDALRMLVANLADDRVGAVGGQLRFEDAQTGFARGVDAYWRYETAIRRNESASGSTIGVSGALYAMRRELYAPLPVGTVLDDVLIPMRVLRGGQRVVFEPEAVAWDHASAQPALERSRKIRTLAGNYQLLQLAPWLLDPRHNRAWFRFVSHKLLRLLAPWLLLALLVLSAVLTSQHVIYLLSLLALLGVLGLVALGRAVPTLARLLPVRLATAFCYLNVFAAQALIAFARNRRLHLW